MKRRRGPALVLTLALAGAASTAAASGLPPETQQALARVPPALDGAEAALPRCPDPRIAARTRAAIAAARGYLAVVEHGKPGAIVQLNVTMDLIRRNLADCVGLTGAVAAYQAKCHGPVRLGMTEAEVRQTAWCRPSKVETTERQGKVMTEWVYPQPKKTGWTKAPIGYLYFTDGRLTRIKQTTR